MSVSNFTKVIPVTYTDSDGLAWRVLVPEHTPESDYDMGIVLGPPDLTVLNLDFEVLKKLQRALVKHNLIVAPDLMGKRKLLKQILLDLNIPEPKLIELMFVYQKEYYNG